MKITITEIESTAEELKVSNSLADGLSGMLRGVFNNAIRPVYHTYDEEEDEEAEE